MLESLCGNKNVQKILLFLFVNGKCYGTQLHRLLNTSLTPLQKALLRLEKGGIIVSEYEGKTRLYYFNPSFPLLAELEQLLKKAYTLLSPQEKRIYCSIDPKSPPKIENPKQILRTFWHQLCYVKALKFTAKIKTSEGIMIRRGQGEVTTILEDSVLTFHEKGNWMSQGGTEMNFTNTFRWTLDYALSMISLEHLRHGINSPVFLFHLAPSARHTLASVDAHLCADDAYFGQLISTPSSLRLKWRVIGPRKNEEMDYYYL